MFCGLIHITVSVTELDTCCEKYKRRTWSFLLRVRRGGQDRMHGEYK